MSPPWSWTYTTSPSNAPPLWAGPGRSRVSTANPTDGAPAEPVRCSSFRMATWSTARKTTRPAGAFDVSSELSGFVGRAPGGMVRNGTSGWHPDGIRVISRDVEGTSREGAGHEEQSCSNLERRPWRRKRRGPPCQRRGGRPSRVVGLAHGRGRRQDQPRGADRWGARRLLLHGALP